MPRIVGISKALEWCFSGDVFDANQAFQAGLIKEITTPEELMPRAVEIATELTKKSSPVSIALTRQMMWKMLGADHPIEAHKIDSRGIQIRGSSRDGVEGIKSFLEKRPAKFMDSVTKDMPDYYPWWKPRKFRLKTFSHTSNAVANAEKSSTTISNESGVIFSFF